jgi:D-threo-aldose 1-dehydrogenase
MNNGVKVRTLAKGLALTELGFGTAQFGNLYRETSDEVCTAAVRAAWDAGIRYFDTAPHYGLGLAERRLGAALQDYPRDDYVISTKVGRLLVPSPEGADRLDDQGFAVPASVRREWDFSRDGVLRSIEESLERLGLDRIDIAYLHDPDDHWESASTTGINTLIELRDQGVVRAVGAGMNQSAMLTEFIRQSDVDVVMLSGRYTLYEQGALYDLLPIAADRGVGVVAVSVYNSGLLSSPIVGDKTTYNYMPAPPDVIARAREIAAICERHGVTLPEAAVRFPFQHPAITAVALGTRTPEHVASGMARYRAAIPDRLWVDLRDTDLLRNSTGTDSSA